LAQVSAFSSSVGRILRVSFR